MSDTDVTQNSPLQQTQQHVPSQPINPVQSPAAPSSISGHKEHAPVAPIADVKIQEVAKPPEISSELKEAGVEHGTDAKEQKLSEEVKKAGVTLTKDATPMQPPQSSSNSNLPLSYEDAVLAAKKDRKAKNSRSWWLKEVIREWKKTLLGKGEQ